METWQANGVAGIKRQADAYAQSVAPHIAAIEAAGHRNPTVIARELQRRGIKTPRGGPWLGRVVERIKSRLGQ